MWKLETFHIQPRKYLISSLAYRKKTSIGMQFILFPSPRGVLKHSGADLQLTHGQSPQPKPWAVPSPGGCLQEEGLLRHRHSCSSAQLHTCIFSSWNPTLPFWQNILMSKVKEMCYCLPLPWTAVFLSKDLWKGFFLLDSPNLCLPLPPLCSRPLSSGPADTYHSIPYQAQGSMGISSHHLHRFKKQTRLHSTFMFPS